MKQIRNVLLLIVISIFVLSCSKQPTACFTVDKDTAQVDSPIALDASCSIDAESYSWSGEGFMLSVGGTESPTNTATFSAAGVYTITLTVENGNKTDEISKTVTITQ